MSVRAAELHRRPDAMTRTAPSSSGQASITGLFDRLTIAKPSVKFSVGYRPSSMVYGRVAGYKDSTWIRLTSELHQGRRILELRRGTSCQRFSATSSSEQSIEHRLLKEGLAKSF